MSVSRALIETLYSRKMQKVMVEVAPGKLEEVLKAVSTQGLDKPSEAVSRIYQAFNLPQPPMPSFLSNVPVPPMVPPLPFIRRTSTRFGMFNLLASASIISALNRIPGVVLISPDYEVSCMQMASDLKPPVPQKNWRTSEEVHKEMGIDKAWEKGYKGKGIKVAVVDTDAGLPPHPSMNRSGMTVLPFQIFDEVGHGSWCCHAVNGPKWKHPQSGIEMYGAAPEAQVYAVKALGYGIGTGSVSDIIAGIDAAMDWKPDIVSMSLGAEVQTGEAEDAIARAVNKASQTVLFCVAAGNSGDNGPNTIMTPGIASGALTVGSWSITDKARAHFSGIGPTVDGVIKPDVLGCGGGTAKAPDMLKGEADENIYGACPLFSSLDSVEDKQNDMATAIAGTSMSTPRVAGLLALISQRILEETKAKPTMAQIKNTMAQGAPKSNNVGWGLMSWSRFNPGG